MRRLTPQTVVVGHFLLLKALLLTTLLCSTPLLATKALSSDITLDCNNNQTVTPTNDELPWPHIMQKTVLTPSYWLDVEQVKPWLSAAVVEAKVKVKQPLYWLDVRRASAQKAYPLADALAIPLSSIIDKTALRQQRLVLIGDGFDQPELEQTVGQLRQQGFEQVYALRGGIFAKLILNNSLNGSLTNSDHTLSQHWRDLSPAQLLAGSRTLPWTVIAWDIDGQDINKLPQPLVESWSATNSNTQLNDNTLLNNNPSLLAQRILAETQLTADQSMLPTMVIIAADNQATAQLKTLLTTYGVTTEVFWLSGGMQAYKNYITQQHNIQINTGLSLRRSCTGVAL